MSRETLSGLRRGLRVLEALGREVDGLRFSDLQSICDDAPPSTVSRLIAALLDEKLIVQDADTRAYRLTHRSHQLGASLCEASSQAERIRPAVRQLAARTGQSAAFFVFDGEAALLLVKHELPEAFHYMPEGNTNVRFSRHGFARILLAFQSDVIQQTLMAPDDLPEGMSPTAFLQEQADIRRRKAWINRQDDRRGVIRIVAPVLADKRLIGAIGVSLFESACLPEEIELMAKPAAQAAAQAAWLATH